MCLGKCQHPTDAMVRWERQILEVVGTHEYPQLHDIAEEPVDVVIFRCSGLLSKGVLKSRGSGRSSIHFNAENSNVGLLLKTVIAVNQLSIYEAVEKSCNSQLTGEPNNFEGHWTRKL